MADDEARRARRRRKILENSEDRLKKLTNSTKVSDERVEGLIETAPKTKLEPKFVSKSTSEEVIQEKFVQLNDSATVLPDVNTENLELERYLRNLSDSSLRRRALSASYAAKLTDPIEFTTQVTAIEGKNVTRPAKILPSVVILRRKTICFLFAVIGWILLYNFDELYMINELITFSILALELGIFITETFNEREPNAAGTLTAALILCGIKNAKYFSLLFQNLYYVVEDFAIFFFTFFLCHMLIGKT